MEANWPEGHRVEDFQARRAAWRAAILSTCNPAQAEAFRNLWLRVDGGLPQSSSEES